MTQLPNIITLLRIADSLGLLLCDVTSVAYWIIYALCGISDIADGWLARHKNFSCHSSQIDAEYPRNLEE